MCDACKDVNQFLAFMTTPQGVPVVTADCLDWLIKKGFFEAPASTRFHGAYEGGLFDHSLCVTKHLVELTERNGLKWKLDRSPYLVGMFHDLCKIDQYKYNGPDKWEHRSDTFLKGHGDKSVMLLSQFYNLTEEEILCIRYHMGAFVEKEEWRDYTRAVNAYPNVLWTHQADMLAAHVSQV